MHAAFLAAVLALAPISQLPTPRAPLGVPSTAKTDALGEMLFNERGLSINGTVSCADCHQPERGFSDGLVVAEGVNGRRGTVNTPTIHNACYKIPMFNNGRILTIERQVLEPLVNQVEMANSSVDQVVNALRRNPFYAQKFAECYKEGVTTFTLAHAIASYESKVVSFDAPIDDYMAGDENAISEQAKRGLEKFMLRRCDECHPYPLLTDLQYHNNGAGYRIFRGNRPRGRNSVLPQQNQRQELEGAVITATLRDVRRSGPYMSSGRFPSLASVTTGYGQGMAINGRHDRFIDPRIAQQPPMTREDLDDFEALFDTFTSRSYPYSGQSKLLLRNP